MTPVRAVLLDFSCTLVDLSEPVRSPGFDDFARRLGLPLGPGELYRRYTEMATSEPAEDGGPGLCPYRMSWLAAGRRLLAPFGRESAAGQFADAYADSHARAVIFPDVPDAVRTLVRHVRTAVVANADHDYLMRRLNHNGLRFDSSWTPKPPAVTSRAPGSFSASATSRQCPRARRRWSETLRKPTSSARARQVSGDRHLGPL